MGWSIIARRRAIALDPKYAVAHNDLGTLLERIGRLREAEAAYLKAIEADPRHSRAHCNLAGLRKRAGKPEDAARLYRKALARPWGSTAVSVSN